MRKSLIKTTLLALLMSGIAIPQATAQTRVVEGVAKVEKFSNIGGTAVSDLTNHVRFPDDPDSYHFVQYLEFPAGNPEDGITPPPSDVDSDYGVRISGYITPTTAGNYTFYIAADDGAAFYLSTDDDPANMELVAWEPTWNGVRAFTATDRRPGCLDAVNPDCENISDPISLQAGTSYYFEAYMKEGGGGDNLAVAWSSDGTAPTVPIAPEFLSAIVSETLAIREHPANKSVPEGSGTTLSVKVNDTPGVTYQWLKDGNPIGGATGAAYDTPVLTLADTGTEYSVEVSDGTTTVTSDVATVTVVPTVEYEGFLKMEIWTGITGTAHPTDPVAYQAILDTPPDAVRFLSSFDSLPNWGDNYLAVISGWITVQDGGDYDFFLRADDTARFFISLDETLPDPVNGFSTIYEEVDPCCEAFIEPYDVNDLNLGQTTTFPTLLQAGQKYGIVATLKEGTGGDFIQVAMRPYGATTPAAASLTPIPGSLLSTMGAELYIDQQPEDVTVVENRPATLSAAAGATPGVTYQWQSAPAGSSTFTDIEGATSATYTFDTVRADDQMQFRVVLNAPLNDTVTSEAATLTVAVDEGVPTVTGVLVSPERNGLFLSFSEPMSPTGLDVAGNYTLSGGATVTGAQAFGDQTVFLTLGGALAAETEYTLTISDDVRDVATGGGNPVAPTTDFTTPVAAPAETNPFITGLVQYDQWVGPNTLALLATEIDARAADYSLLLGIMEAPSYGDATNNYGARVTTYFVPPETGVYKFFISSDDAGQLYLSTDSNPANRKLIATEPSYNGRRVWTGLDRRNVNTPENRSATYTGTQWPGGNRIALVGGQKYYMELRFAEGGGGDNGDVTYALFDDPDPANGTLSALTGERVGLFQDVSASPPIITALPVGQTFDAGDDITLTADAAGATPLTFQWFKNKQAIAGATSKTLTITDAGVADIGDYSFEASNNLGSANTFLQDNSARLIMRGAFNIEAEDYNYNGGQYLEVASQMPYLGRAYEGLTSVADVDFMNANETTDAGAYAYGRHSTTDLNVVETKGPNDPADYNRGSFSVTNNYAVGWGSTGDWQNYTRNIPEGRYSIVAAVAEDGLTGMINHTLSLVDDPTIADGSVVGTEGGAQGLTPLGTFVTPSTGAWSSNDLVPLTDDAGNIVEVELGGLTTFRWTMNDASDSDYLLFYCLDCETVDPGEIEITATTLADGNITVTWTGGGTLWSSPAVTGGTWTSTGDSDGSFTEAISGTAKFYQVQQ